MDKIEPDSVENSKSSPDNSSGPISFSNQKNENPKTPRTLSKIPEIVARLTDPTEGIKLSEKKSLLKVHRNCFTGSELIDWFVVKKYVVNRTTGVALGAILLKEGVIYCTSTKDGPFKDGDSIYKFNNEKNLNYFQDKFKFRRIDTHHLLNEQRYSIYAFNKPETDPSSNPKNDNVARCLVIQEIIETEKFYLKSLDTAIEKYMKPIQHTQTLSERKIKKIFNNIEGILETSQLFLKILFRDIPKGYDELICIGKCFLEIIPRLDVYAIYARNHQQCIKQMLKLEYQKPSFIQYLNQIRDREGVLDLMSLLIQPVQRIPRYKLLLEDVLKKTPESHPDNKDLKLALQKIEDIANTVNESIRKYENLQKLNQVVKLFGNAKELDELIVETRTVIKEGPLTKIGRKSHMERYFVLLNDILLYGAKALNGNHYTLKRILYMDKTLVKDMADSTDVTNSFLILSVGKSFIVYAATVEEKKAWLEEFMKLQRTDSNVDVAPVWMNDGESDACVRCGRQFTTLFRRHHCRNCGLLVCNRCSSRKAVVPKVDPNRISRVCDDCFKKLNAITAETLIQLEFEENADSANYSKLQEGVVCGLLKGTPSKVDKMLGMKSPSPLKFARKSNIICAKQEETETKEPEENLTAAQKLEQLTLATPNSWGYHLYNVSLRVVS